MLDLSVIILNYNVMDFLRQCLKSIYDNTHQITFEVLVVDNNSKDDSVKMVKEEFPEVKVIENSYNAGFAKANNQGLEISRGRYAILLNNDTLILPGALDKLVQFMDEHPETGAVGSKVLNADGTIQLSCRSFPSHINAIFNSSSPLTKLFPKNRFSSKYLMKDWDHNKGREVDWISGACLLVRREVVEDVGGLDEDYFMFCEDTDWCYRIKKRGWKIYYVPEASIIHYGGQASKLHSNRVIIEHHKSMWLFYNKHYRKDYNFFLTWITALAIIGRAMLALTSNNVHKLLNKGQKS